MLERDKVSHSSRDLLVRRVGIDSHHGQGKDGFGREQALSFQQKTSLDTAAYRRRSGAFWQ
jgi:hypothetical protein